MVKLSWADHLRMEAEKEKKSNLSDTKEIDFYDTDILEKTTNSPKAEAETQKPKDKYGNEDQKLDLEFHEQFFS